MSEGSEVEFRFPLAARIPVTLLLAAAALVQVFWAFGIHEVPKWLVLASFFVMWIALLAEFVGFGYAKLFLKPEPEGSEPSGRWIIHRRRD